MSGAANEGLPPQPAEKTSLSNTEQSVPSKSLHSRNEPSHISEASEPGQDAASKTPHLVVVSDDADNADGMGPRLRAAREALGMSIEEVAKVTRIRKEYLLDIEDMYVKNLPGMPSSKSYLRGWVKSYARHVEMNDVDQIVERYLRECGLQDAPASSVRSNASVETAVTGAAHAREQADKGKGGFIAGLATALVMVGAIGAAVWFLGPWSDDGAPAVKTRAPVESATTAPLPPQFGPSVATVNLSLKAVETSWIEVRGSDGTVYLSKQMIAGDVYVPRVGAGWTVTVQDGSAFEWRLNGDSLGLIDAEGGQVHAASVDAALQREPVSAE